jgi:hypothetical protein
MPYRKLDISVTWHWCHDCSDWPLKDFRQREDKPPTWSGQSLCEECATRDHCSQCQHSVELSTGREDKFHRNVAVIFEAR